jgi:hypothetical protein
MNREIEPVVDARIDAALRSVGTAKPAPGLEGRILNQVASARMAMETETPGRAGAWRLSWLTRSSAPVLGVASSILVAGVIVAGSVSHSRRIAPAQTPAPPVLHLPGSGLGAASAAHAAGPSSAPIPAGKASRGRSAGHAGQGRARIAPHAKKAQGVVVPDPSANPQN